MLSRGPIPHPISRAAEYTLKALSCQTPEGTKNTMNNATFFHCSHKKWSSWELWLFKKSTKKEIPGDPVVRTWCFHRSDPGSIPGQGTKITQSHVVWAKKKKKKYQINKQKFITTNNKTKQFFLWLFPLKLCWNDRLIT